MSTPSSAGGVSEGQPLRLLFVADVVGKAGRQAIERLLPSLMEERSVDFCLLNAENAAGGAGLTQAVAASFFDRGVDVLTSGNHIWDNREIFRFIDDEPRILRPANYAPSVPGRGFGRFRARNGTQLLVANLQGRVFMETVDCPFRTIEEILSAESSLPPIRVVDFHAEATSEKQAMGWFLDGRVTAVIGTHTHVPTADERLLPGGTAYITDVGMTGPHDSVIGVKKEGAIHRMTTKLPVRFETATGDVRLSGLYVECDTHSGKALRVERIQRRLEA